MKGVLHLIDADLAEGAAATWLAAELYQLEGVLGSYAAFGQYLLTREQAERQA